METIITKSIFTFISISLINTAIYLILPQEVFYNDNCLFRVMKWEDNGLFYDRVFKIKKWKDVMPELGDFLSIAFKKKNVKSFDKEYLKQFIAETRRAEICHWSIILSMLLNFIYRINWINGIVFIITFLLNAPFIIIQRFNRPRMVTVLMEQDKKKSMDTYSGKILFISADNTGNGHKSITEALTYQVHQLDDKVQLKVIDGFSLGSYLFRAFSNLYNPIAVKTPLIWGWFFKLSNHLVNTINIICSRIIKRKLLSLLNEEKPDIIISVHALFVGSVIRIITNKALDIPVISCVADLDNVSNLWADKRARYILCPTKEAEEKMKLLGISTEKLKVMGFPVRKEFCMSLPLRMVKEESTSSSISLLFISGSQGSRQVLKMSKELLMNTDSRITIIAGKDEKLKKQLCKELGKYLEERVNIIGYTKEIKKYMVEADVLIVRASPNVLMEAINLCKPIIVIGALKGQEEKNPDFVARYQLGYICENYNMISSLVNELYSCNRQKLQTLTENLRCIRNPEASYNIARFIIDQYKQQINGFNTMDQHKLKKDIPRSSF